MSKNIFLQKSLFLKNKITIFAVPNKFIMPISKELLTGKLKEFEHTASDYKKLSIVACKANIAVTIMDKNGNYIWINQSYTDIYGFSFEQLLVERGVSIFGQYTDPNIKIFFSKCILTKSTVVFEFYYTKRNGQKIWMQSILTPIIENGSVVQIVAIDSDITKLKEAEIEIRVQADVLNSANIKLEEHQEEILVQSELLRKANKELQDVIYNLKTLSEIGQQITSHLSAEKIIDTIYENVSLLMKSEVFSIGIFNSKQNSLEFLGTMEKGKKLSPYSYSLSEENRIAVQCFLMQKEIIISDFETEYLKYIKNRLAPVQGESPQSLIYLPLNTKEKQIGVITVQNFEKYTYSFYHLHLLRSISIYAAIALENADNFFQIEKQKQNITDSILYASRIQQALLPSTKLLSEHFSGYFIYWKPRDIVSGDFYWFAKVDDNILITAVDCTGHGVPGAFMSILGVAFLNEVILQRKILQPSEILNELRKMVKNALSKDEKQFTQSDGMDMAFCTLDLNTLELQYAGAHNPLFLFQKNEHLECKEVKPDKMPVAAHIRDNIPFTNHTFQLQKGDTFYLFSDGYPSQLGQKPTRQYSIKRLQETFTTIQNQEMEEQKISLQESLSFWQTTIPQLDDILIIGIKL